MGLRALSDKHLLFKFHTKASARERKQSARSKGTPSSAEKVLLLLDKSLGLLLSPTPNTHMQDLTALIATHTHTCILLQMQWHKFALWFSSLTLHINNKDRRQQEAYLSTNYFIFWYGFFEGTVKDILIGEKNKKNNRTFPENMNGHQWASCQIHWRGAAVSLQVKWLKCHNCSHNETKKKEAILT